AAARTRKNKVPDGAGGERLVPRLVRVAPPPPTAVRFDPSAAYLITGGVGGIGRHVARGMGDHGGTDLVLTGVHDRARGDEFSSLRAAGARIEIAQIDAADRGGMSALV